MSTGTRIFITISVVAALLMTATAGAATAALRAGTVAVDVAPHDGGGITVSLPAALINLAVALAPRDVLEDVQRELEPVWPTVCAAARELDRAPDFVLLEIRSSEQLVRIEKKNRRMLVAIETNGDNVRIAIPLKTVRRLAERIADADRRG